VSVASQLPNCACERQTINPWVPPKVPILDRKQEVEVTGIHIVGQGGKAQHAVARCEDTQRLPIAGQYFERSLAVTGLVRRKHAIQNPNRDRQSSRMSAWVRDCLTRVRSCHQARSVHVFDNSLRQCKGTRRHHPHDIGQVEGVV